MAESRRDGPKSKWSRIARRIRVPLGFAFALLYIWLARPTWPSLGLGAIAILSGLLIRALASGHVRKNEALATTGPYAYTRNPLYLGSLLIGVGFAVAARNWWIGLGLVVMFFAIYLPVIYGEENFLRNNFPEFNDYAKRVPRLLPRLTRDRPARDEVLFSTELYLKHREWNALLGTAAMIVALVLKLLCLRTS